MKNWETAVAKFSKKTDEVNIEGSFQFEIGKKIYTEDLSPRIQISFTWCPEIPQSETFTEDDVLSMFGYKLANDFLTFIKKSSVMDDEKMIGGC